MCKKKLDLHQNNKGDKVEQDKPNEAELFFLLNEDILN